MNKIFLFLILFTSKCFFLLLLLYIGEVESRYWNDSWDKFYDYPLTVYAGGDPDGSERSVLIKIKNSFGDDYYKYFKSQKCTEKQIKKNKCFLMAAVQPLTMITILVLFILEKSIEWSKIAN